MDSFSLVTVHLDFGPLWGVRCHIDQEIFKCQSRLNWCSEVPEIFKQPQVAFIGPNVCQYVWRSVCLSVGIFLWYKYSKTLKHFWLFDCLIILWWASFVTYETFYKSNKKMPHNEVKCGLCASSAQWAKLRGHVVTTLVLINWTFITNKSSASLKKLCFD